MSLHGDPYLPPGYTGVDRPSQAVYLECPQGHVWLTQLHHEYGIDFYGEYECPHCSMDGGPTDAEEPNDAAYRVQCDGCGEWVDEDWTRSGYCLSCYGVSAIE